jgi:transposase-like protein
MNLIQVASEFQTEEQCLEFLANSRWPAGVRCPVCGNDKVTKITRKTVGDNKRPFTYACSEPTCKHRFSPTAGTIFHGSHIPLRTWFLAITIVMDAKKGMSAKQVQQHLAIGSYRTAWYMVHRIRKAMAEEHPTKMDGIVEMDETYIGGKSKRRGRKVTKPRSEKFDMVIGMRERGGRVRFFHTPNARKATIKEIVDRHLAHNAKIVTDQAIVYDFALDENFKKNHTTVNHNTEWVGTDGFTHTNTIESAFSLLKRGLIGSFHRVSIKHLHRYLSEFEYRFNVRNINAKFEGILERLLKTETMPYKQLIAPVSE